MNTKTKSAFVLLATLILGIFLGFLIKSWIMEDKFERIGRIGRPGGLMHIIQENIDLSEKQKTELKPLVEYYHKKITSLSIGTRNEVIELIDSLKNQMKEILTDDQFEKITNSYMFNPPKNFRSFKKHGGRKRDSTDINRRLEYKPDSVSWKKFRKMKMDSIKKQINKDKSQHK